MAQEHRPRNPEWEQALRTSFGSQGLMRHLGATLSHLEPGICWIELPFSENLTQQHGYFHAGGVSAIIDSAGGYAGFSLMPAGAAVLTVEFKLNLIAPAQGDRLIAKAEVVKSGRTLTVTRGEVIGIQAGQETVCALMQQTLISLEGSKIAG